MLDAFLKVKYSVRQFQPELETVAYAVSNSIDGQLLFCSLRLEVTY